MADSMTDHGTWDTAMRRAIELAAGSHAPFGAVIVRIDRPESVVFEGGNSSGSDPTGHAEVNAIRAMASAGVTGPARDYGLVTTAEPCPMCAAACWWAELGLIVYGTSIAELSRNGWRQIAITARTVVSQGSGTQPPEVIGPWRQEWTDPLYRGSGKSGQTLVNPVREL
ncbi:hypothetical protein GC170_13030 [bacterium]|nr:hypothetical protein [bacterium]